MKFSALNPLRRRGKRYTSTGPVATSIGTAAARELYLTLLQDPPAAPLRTPAQGKSTERITMHNVINAARLVTAAYQSGSQENAVSMIQGRDASIRENIIEAAVSAGLNRQDAVNVLSRVGFDLPPQPQAAAPTQDGASQRRLNEFVQSARRTVASIKAQLDSAERELARLGN